MLFCPTLSLPSLSFPTVSYPILSFVILCDAILRYASACNPCHRCLCRKYTYVGRESLERSVSSTELSAHAYKPRGTVHRPAVGGLSILKQIVPTRGVVSQGADKPSSNNKTVYPLKFASAGRVACRVFPEIFLPFVLPFVSALVVHLRDSFPAADVCTICAPITHRISV